MMSHPKIQSATTRKYDQDKLQASSGNSSPSISMNQINPTQGLNSSTTTTLNSTPANLSNNNNNNILNQPRNHLSTTPDISSSKLNDSTSSLAIQPYRNIPANSSFKEQKKSYDLRKKYFTKNIQSAIESTQEVHSGWLKARTTFKRWTKVWCQIKPGYLIMYTSQEAQKRHRFGVVLLSVCQLIKRPTKKEGYCFKLINPFACSVWALSSTRAIVLPQSSVTLRASDHSVGELWIDALHLCNLSANLEGYQPIVEHSIHMIDGRRSTSSDSEDDGESSTRNLESILGRRSNSDNQSMLSSLNNSPCKNSQQQQFGSNRKNLLDDYNKQQAKFINGDGTLKEANASATANQTYKMMSSSQVGRTDIFNQLISNNNNNNINNNSNSKSTATSHTNENPSASKMVAKFNKYNWKELQLESVAYLPDEGTEELGSAGAQSEEVHESNKNFLWHIIKQLRPGMDLSKVTLPTFILEPRSFLEKLADYYYHCDILSEAVLIDDPVMRLIGIVKWYLSGFYKKPKGPKKPYNPILGESFRCFWDHPKTQSRTFFVAEQVSHHPPISAFHVSNRKDGYVITCSPLSRSKFGGNSVSAILDGKAKLYFTRRNETYTLTLPYAHCRGILLGSLCLELGGKVEIECAETECKCELDFKLAAVFASANSYNSLTGKILKSNKVTHTLEGHWDKKINIIDKRDNEKSVLWEVNDTVRNSRLKRYTVDLKDQAERESVKLWKKVSEALANGDQELATAEKTKLEDMQRQEARERKSPFVPAHFEQRASGSNEWLYKWQDVRLWNESQDIMQFEDNFKVKTLVLKSASKTEGYFNPHIDMPLTQLSKLSERNDASTGTIISPDGLRLEGTATNSYRGNANSDAVKSIQSNLDAKNQLIEQAIKQMTERSRKLEEDIANLKRGKKTVALVMTAIIVALLSAFFTYFP